MPSAADEITEEIPRVDEDDGWEFVQHKPKFAGSPSPFTEDELDELMWDARREEFGQTVRLWGRGMLAGFVLCLLLIGATTDIGDDEYEHRRCRIYERIGRDCPK